MPESLAELILRLGGAPHDGMALASLASRLCRLEGRVTNQAELPPDADLAAFVKGELRHRAAVALLSAVEDGRWYAIRTGLHMIDLEGSPARPRRLLRMELSVTPLGGGRVVTKEEVQNART